jgi:tRNA A-37 threonylcarbamoyl transferase component Bud32
MAASPTALVAALREPNRFLRNTIMKSKANDIRWDIVASQAHFFNQYGTDDPERLIRESLVIKEGHKRAVYRHRDRPIYIKRMPPQKARKEWRNWKGLHEKGVDIITPVAMGISRDHGYLVSIAHHDWPGLYDVFDRATRREKVCLLQKLGQVIRTMHGAGFYHGDLHGGNFLGRLDGGQPKIKMVDFQRGRFCRLSRRQRLANLADLAISRFFVLGMRERLAFLEGFSGNRLAAIDLLRREGKQLEKLILKHSSQAADRKVKKFRKVNKYFNRLTVQTPYYRGVCLKKNLDSIPSDFLYSPLNVLYGNNVEVLKDSRSVRVVRYHDVCIKYYKRRTPKDVLKGWMGLSKGKKSFRWALSLTHRQISTPEPISYLDGLKGDTFYLSCYVHATPNLDTYLKEASQDKAHMCLRALALFLKHMFYQGAYHLDLKGSNILVKRMGRDIDLYLIDTDEVAICWNGSRRMLKKSLLRITRTLSHHFSRQALVAFVELSLAGLPTSMGMAEASEDLVAEALKIEGARIQG